MTRRRTNSNAATDDGFIVVAVLWILGGLAVLASIYSIYVVKAATRLEISDDRVQARALISASLELTAYHFDGTGGLKEPTRGSFTFRLGKANVGVSFVSEAARIDLNAAPKPLLSGLFAALGASSGKADYYADRVIAWRTPGRAGGSRFDGEAAAYRAAGLSYLPRQGPFASAQELWLVLGLPTSLVKSAMPYVTVFSGLAGVDVFDAAPEVIAALPGMSSEQVYAVLQQRRLRPDDLQGIVRLLGPAAGSVAKKPAKAVRVITHVDLDNGRRVKAEAVILLVMNGDEPYRILSWRDDFDGSIGQGNG